MKLLTGIFLALLLISSSLSAGTVIKVRTTDTSNVDITFDSWLEHCPQVGHVPVTVQIKNGSPSSHTWDFRFTGGNSYESTILSQYSLSVEAGHTGTMICYIPIVARSYSGGQYNTLNMTVSGYGTEESGVSSLGSSNVYGSASTEFIAISKVAGSNGNHADLINKFNSSGSSSSTELNGCEVDMRSAPTDWRGYTGLAQLWLHEGEWTSLHTASKSALMEWVAFGGRVFILAADTSPERGNTLGLGATVNGESYHGAGTITLVAWDGKKLPINKVAEIIRSTDKLNLREETGDYTEAWKLASHRGALTLNSMLIFGFIVLFGLLVGPVNLFILAGANKRSRLFWTTPLISLAGSALLIVLMVMQDGIGGDGARQVLAILQPDQKKIGILQEQTSKTGVLLGNSFAINEPSWMQPVNLIQNGSRYSSDSMDHYSESGNVRSGDWFSSRSVQAHYLQTVRPSRAGVEFFPSSEPGGAPEVISSIEVPLTKVFVMDEQSQVWETSNLATGEKKKLTPSSKEALETWMAEGPMNEAGPVMLRTLVDLKNQPGYVYAESDQAAPLAISTLDSIRWKHDRLFIAGPYVKP